MNGPTQVGKEKNALAANSVIIQTKFSVILTKQKVTTREPLLTTRCHIPQCLDLSDLNHENVRYLIYLPSLYIFHSTLPRHLTST